MDKIKLFSARAPARQSHSGGGTDGENKKVRTIWNDDEESWYFSIVDVIEVLTNSDRPRKYWSDLKAKLVKEGSELSEKIGQLKMAAEDGKMRELM